ncbi:hypothetical protein [Pararobbsia silviterrae]|uniref:hypothetical protein n=1 Tax=Pararobbsia silviterrae TaxID=1792498 RepID=UPI001F0BDF29|nr:hypothetical protein [Pararobbsia silviterrae]
MYASSWSELASCKSTSFVDYCTKLPQGRRASIEAAQAALASLVNELSAMLIGTLQDQLSRLHTLDEQIARIEQRILEWRRNDDACCRISEIPGVSVLTATADYGLCGEIHRGRRVQTAIESGYKSAPSSPHSKSPCKWEATT